MFRRARRVDPEGRQNTAEVRTAHDALLDAHRLQLSSKLESATRAGRRLSDCVGVVVRTPGDPDVVAVIPRRDAIEIAEVAGLHEHLMRPPPDPQLHVFTFAMRVGSVRVVEVRPMARGGDA